MACVKDAKRPFLPVMAYMCACGTQPAYAVFHPAQLKNRNSISTAGWDVKQPELHAWVPGSRPTQSSSHPSIHPSNPPPLEKELSIVYGGDIQSIRTDH